MKTCKVEGCINSKLVAKGYCRKHYAHLWKHGKILNRTRHTPNEFVLKENHAEIVIYDKNNQEKARALIDLDDVEKCREHKWHYDKYPATHVGGYLIRLHTLVFKKWADHIDRNTLNNKKENLREANNSQNTRNSNKFSRKCTSKYKGVSWSTKSNKWQAGISFNNKDIYLGTFKFEKIAAQAYNVKAKELFGEFACLNEV
jgi:hypothetical protein